MQSIAPHGRGRTRAGPPSSQAAEGAGHPQRATVGVGGARKCWGGSGGTGSPLPTLGRPAQGPPHLRGRRSNEGLGPRRRPLHTSSEQGNRSQNAPQGPSLRPAPAPGHPEEGGSQAQWGRAAWMVRKSRDGAANSFPSSPQQEAEVPRTAHSCCSQPSRCRINGGSPGAGL